MDSGCVKAGSTASTNPESRIPKPGFIESTVGSSGRRRAGAGNTSDFPLAILPRTGAAGSAWTADARPTDAPKGVAPHDDILAPVELFVHREEARPQGLWQARLDPRSAVPARDPGRLLPRIPVVQHEPGPAPRPRAARPAQVGVPDR